MGMKFHGACACPDDEAEISEEKRLFTESRQGIQ